MCKIRAVVASRWLVGSHIYACVAYMHRLTCVISIVEHTSSRYFTTVATSAHSLVGRVSRGPLWSHTLYGAFNYLWTQYYAWWWVLITMHVVHCRSTKKGAMATSGWNLTKLRKVGRWRKNILNPPHLVFKNCTSFICSCEEYAKLWFSWFFCLFYFFLFCF